MAQFSALAVMSKAELLRCRHASQGSHGGAVSQVALPEGECRCRLPGRGNRPWLEVGEPALVSCGALTGKDAYAKSHIMRDRCRHNINVASSPLCLAFPAGMPSRVLEG